MVSVIAGCSIAAACGIATAGTTTVYKCFDRNLGVLYTDQRCKGEQLDIRAGDPDPVAIAELAREREALSQSAAQPIADPRRAAIERDVPAAWNYPEPNGIAYVPDYGGWGWIPNATEKRPREDARPAPRRERQSVPNPLPPRQRK
jgi:hypothetical protein